VLTVEDKAKASQSRRFTRGNRWGSWNAERVLPLGGHRSQPGFRARGQGESVHPPRLEVESDASAAIQFRTRCRVGARFRRRLRHENSMRTTTRSFGASEEILAAERDMEVVGEAKTAMRRSSSFASSTGRRRSRLLHARRSGVELIRNKTLAPGRRPRSEHASRRGARGQVFKAACRLHQQGKRRRGN